MRIFDLHCDTIYECLTKAKTLGDTSLHINFADAPKTEGWVQFFAVFVPDDLRGPAAVSHTKKAIETYEKQRIMFSDRFCEKPRPNRCVGLLSIEGGAALGGDIGKISEYYNQGVSMMTLTWNGLNELGGGQEDGGALTEFGFSAVAEMERVGMVVDVSHLSDAGFNDVLSAARKPFCASHSNARAVCNHKRNLTDRQFCAIKDSGGIVGIVLCDIFLKEGGGSDYSDVLRHIAHFLSLGGENTLAFGSDFDGTTLTGKMNGQKDLPELYGYLEKNIGRTAADKIFYKNAERFFSAFLT